MQFAAKAAIRASVQSFICLSVASVRASILLDMLATAVAMRSRVSRISASERTRSSGWFGSCDMGPPFRGSGGVLRDEEHSELGINVVAELLGERPGLALDAQKLDVRRHLHSFIGGEQITVGEMV